MKQFVALYDELDQTTRTTEKVAAMEKYFREAPPEDACWGLYFLAGGRTKRAVNTRLLREWAAEESGLPLWLIEECYDAVGDLAETIALILPQNGDGTAMPLHRLTEERILPLPNMNEDTKHDLVRETWQELNARERLVWHKLVGGGWRAGVAKKLVLRALANVAGIEPAVMEHRFAGGWEPTAENYKRLLSEEDETADTARPYPFCLAHPFDDPPEAMPEKLGDARNWQVEWKWDGIRAQIIRRENEVLIWSRGEEMMTERFPEVAEAARLLPNGTVVDGEILIWGEDRPRPFGDLQRRIGRKTVGKKV